MLDFGFLNQGQLDVVQAAYEWYYYTNEPVFQYEGPPGTGKSVVLYYISQVLDPEAKHSIAAAYTGAAAIVLRKKGFHNAKTLHSLLYKPVQEMVYDKDGNLATHSYFDTPIYDIGFEPKSTEGIDLVFIDEASMVDMDMRREIESRGIRVVACGDLRQLPTVNGVQAYLTGGIIHHLTEIMRQEANNAIVWLSDRAYRGLPIHKGCYGNVLVIEEDEVNNQMIAASDIILCGKNETRDKLNNIMRHEILHIDHPLPQFGEKLVCRRNNWGLELDGISLANGLIGTVTSYMDASMFDGKTFKVDFQPDIMTYPFKNILVDYNYFSADFNQRKFIKNDRYSFGEKMEFAYAITTHLSQGSEWSKGIYYQEYLHKDINNNLNYVGISRFRDYCIYVIPKRKFYFNTNTKV